VKALHNPNFQERFLKVQAYDAVGNSPAEFAEFIQVDRAYASRIVKITGIRADSTETPASASPRPAN
jgi:tripartite-type tricarboxylate transporter receptor subunit TctC